MLDLPDMAFLFGDIFPTTTTSTTTTTVARHPSRGSSAGSIRSSVSVSEDNSVEYSGGQKKKRTNTHREAVRRTREDIKRAVDDMRELLEEVAPVEVYCQYMQYV